MTNTDFLYKKEEESEWWNCVSVVLRPDTPEKDAALMKPIPVSWASKKVVLCLFLLRERAVVEKSLFIDDPELDAIEGYPSPIRWRTEFFPRGNRILRKAG